MNVTALPAASRNWRFVTRHCGESTGQDEEPRGIALLSDGEVKSRAALSINHAVLTIYLAARRKARADLPPNHAVLRVYHADLAIYHAVKWIYQAVESIYQAVESIYHVIVLADQTLESIYQSSDSKADSRAARRQRQSQRHPAPRTEDLVLKRFPFFLNTSILHLVNRKKLPSDIAEYPDSGPTSFAT